MDYIPADSEDVSVVFALNDDGLDVTEFKYSYTRWTEGDGTSFKVNSGSPYAVPIAVTALATPDIDDPHLDNGGIYMTTTQVSDGAKYLFRLDVKNEAFADAGANRVIISLYNDLDEIVAHRIYTLEPIKANVKEISDDETAANNLELACDNYNATRGLSGTALPAVAADGAGGLPISDAGSLDLDTILDANISTRATPAQVGTELTTYATNGVSSQDSVDAIGNNTRFEFSTGEYYLKPTVDENVYKFVVNLKDTNGNMEDPDNNDLAILLELTDTTSKNALLYKELALSNALDATGISGITGTHKKLERTGTGRYFAYVKIDSADSDLPAQLLFNFVYEESTARNYNNKSVQVLDADPATVDANIVEIGGTAVPETSGKLHVLDDEGNTVANEAKQDIITTDVAAIKAKTDDLTYTTIGAIEALDVNLIGKDGNADADGVSFEMVDELIIARVNGRFRQDFPNPGDITFYKRDNLTVLTVVNVTTTGRTRVS